MYYYIVLVIPFKEKEILANTSFFLLLINNKSVFRQALQNMYVIQIYSTASGLRGPVTKFRKPLKTVI